MNYNFPSANEARDQLLADRNSALYDSNQQLAEKAEMLMTEIIASRDKTDKTAFEHLECQYNGLRLQTLLGLADTRGVFTASVPCDVDLMKELNANGKWNSYVGCMGRMEISNVSLAPHGSYGED